MKINKPGKLFDTKLLYYDNLYEVFPKIYKPKYFIRGFLDNKIMSFNVSNDRLRRNTFSDDIIKLGIKYNFVEQGNITWLKIPSYYFNYESK